jgi:hypothetical protein
MGGFKVGPKTKKLGVRLRHSRFDCRKSSAAMVPHCGKHPAFRQAVAREDARPKQAEQGSLFQIPRKQDGYTAILAIAL